MQLIPILLFAVAGGALADVFDRRRLLVVAQLGMATGGLVLALSVLTSTPSLGLVLVLAFVLTAFFVVEHPARTSSVAWLVPRTRLTAALTLTTLNNQAGGVVGPAFAGVLIAAAGLQAAYVLVAAAYAWALILALRLPRLPALATGGLSLRAAAIGLRFAVRQRLIISALAIDLNAMIFGLPLALIPVLGLEFYEVGAAGVGLLAAARGGGALVAAIFSGWIPNTVHMGRAVLAAVAAWSGVTILIGFSAFSFVLGVALVALAGAADVVSAMFRNAIIQLTTPNELRGRVSSIHVLAATSGPRLGDIRGALMSEVLTVQGSVVVGGILALVGAAVLARGFPELWQFNSRRAEVEGAVHLPAVAAPDSIDA
jgi:MFS family permease